MTGITTDTIKEETAYYTTFNWGPLLFRTKVKPNHLKALKSYVTRAMKTGART